MLLFPPWFVVCYDGNRSITIRWFIAFNAREEVMFKSLFRRVVQLSFLAAAILGIGIGIFTLMEPGFRLIGFPWPIGRGPIEATPSHRRRSPERSAQQRSEKNAVHDFPEPSQMLPLRGSRAIFGFGFMLEHSPRIEQLFSHLGDTTGRIVEPVRSIFNVALKNSKITIE
jgi:hypothetical protein